jgi:hypothetical protein
MDDERMRDLAAWLERVEPAHTPSWRAPWQAPDYARETLTEAVHPYVDEYRALDARIRETTGDTGEDPDYALPDPDYWPPAPAMRAMLARLKALRALAWREVPNPAYDPERAAEWWATRGPITQTTITVGQSYAPTPPDADPPS